MANEGNARLLNEREKTHGDYRLTARVARALKREIGFALCDRDDDLDDTMLESLDMIATKISRIVVGDPNEIDHWRDIAGYAGLVVRLLETRANQARVIHLPAEMPRPADLSGVTVTPSERDKTLTFSGAQGSGKSTAMRRALEHLTALGCRVEPDKGSLVNGAAPVADSVLDMFAPAKDFHAWRTSAGWRAGRVGDPAFKHVFSSVSAAAALREARIRYYQEATR